MAVILIIKEQNKESKIKLPFSTVILGRSSKADLRIKDEQLSSQHCSFTLQKSNQLHLKDLTSTNGTFVNGSKQISTKIYVGDLITIGNTSIQIDQDSLSKKEYNDLYNKDRTSIRFINAPKGATQAISHDIYESEESTDASKSKSDISLDFDATLQDQRKPNPKPKPNRPREITKSNISETESFQAYGPKFDALESPGENPREISSGQGKTSDVKEMIDSGYVSSGATKMMKLDKDVLKSQLDKSKRMRYPKSASSKSKAAKKKGGKSKKKKKAPKSIFGKILAIFKK